MREEGDFSPYRRLGFEVRGRFCGEGCEIRPDLAGLQFKVTEVHGTSPTSGPTFPHPTSPKPSSTSMPTPWP